MHVWEGSFAAARTAAVGGNSEPMATFSGFVERSTWAPKALGWLTCMACGEEGHTGITMFGVCGGAQGHRVFSCMHFRVVWMHGTFAVAYCSLSAIHGATVLAGGGPVFV